MLSVKIEFCPLDGIQAVHNKCFIQQNVQYV